MDLAGIAKGVEKDVIRDIVIQLISGFITSYGADALAAKTFNKKLGDKGFVGKIKAMFAAGLDDDAVEALRTNPKGDEAIALNVFLSGLRGYQDGLYAAQADSLAAFFGKNTPKRAKLREQFREKWVLLDNIQQITTLTQLALIDDDKLRMKYIRTSGALDSSIAERKLKKQNKKLRKGNKKLKQQFRETRSKSLVEKVLDGSIFKIF